MRWGKVEITGGFLLMAAWINYCDTQLLLPMAVCAAVFHELGHWMAVRMVGGRIALLRLSAVGAQMCMENALSYGQEILCALTGPLFNFVMVCFSVWAGHDIFAGMNLALGVFNLLPISALDGGRVLNCATTAVFGTEVSGCVCKIVDVIFSAAVSVIGVILFFTGGSVTLLLAAAWLWKCEGER